MIDRRAFLVRSAAFVAGLLGMRHVSSGTSAWDGVTVGKWRRLTIPSKPKFYGRVHGTAPPLLVPGDEFTISGSDRSNQRYFVTGIVK